MQATRRSAVLATAIPGNRGAAGLFQGLPPTTDGENAKSRSVRLLDAGLIAFKLPQQAAKMPYIDRMTAVMQWTVDGQWPV